ncbi:MAG: acetyl-CoA C-acyltransferase [bacterium]
MSLQQAYIISAQRTPVGKAPRGMFSTVRPDDMLAFLIRSLCDQAEWLDNKEIDDVVIGCAMPEAEQGINVARVSVLLAGLPDNVPAITINRFCSSGLQAISMAADRIRSGAADIMLAGGTESMSMIPMMGHKPSGNPNIFKDDHVSIAYGMGITAEKVAEQWDVSREQQDAFALSCHEKALKAQSEGQFNDEILPYTIDSYTPDMSTGQSKHSSRVVDQDEGPRAGSSMEKLAKLRTVFRADGSVTAATSSQMSDGAGLVLIVSEKIVKQFNLEPLARYVSYAVAGVPPEIMGIGPIKAIPKALKMAGLNKDQLDWIELNEAFAAQSLAVMKDCELDPDKVNPLGGAIALGHPLGATGAIRTATITHGLKRRGGGMGMVTMCIGTGMGAAGIFEVY